MQTIIILSAIIIVNNPLNPFLTNKAHSTAFELDTRTLFLQQQMNTYQDLALKFFCKM